jgi:hypothetical protein
MHDDHAAIQELNQLWSEYQRQAPADCRLQSAGRSRRRRQALNGESDKQFLALKAQIQTLIKINHQDAAAASAEGIVCMRMPKSMSGASSPSPC